MKIPRPYLALLGIILFFVFIFFSYLVAKEKFTTFDFNTTVKFQDHIPRKFDYPFSVLSIIGRAEITMVIWGLMGLYLLIRRFWKAAFSLILLPIALVIEIFGKNAVLHPAPPYLFYRGVIKYDFPTDFIHSDYSYPSGHLTRTAFLVFFLMLYVHYRYNIKVQFIAIPILLGFLVIMGVSRIYLGEHWTSDVIGGTLMGISFGLLSGMFIPTKKIHHSAD